jgi:hypothetical protein
VNGLIEFDVGQCHLVILPDRFGNGYVFDRFAGFEWAQCNRHIV